MSEKKPEKEPKTEDSSKITEDLETYIRKRAKDNGLTIDETIKEMFDSSGLIVFDETVLKGKAPLKFINLWEVQSKGGQTESGVSDLISQFRDLRENFAPVASGVEFHRTFTITNFEPKIENEEDPHQKDVKGKLTEWCKTISQDDFRVGLGRILKIMHDEALTVGASAAEIVYANSDKYNFNIYAKIDKVLKPNPDPNNRYPKKEYIEVVTEVFEPVDWKTEMGGIARLKIIDDAISRLKPVRDPVSYEILYWVLDDGKPTMQRFHWWEIFWLPHDPQGTDIFGRSIIKSVVKTAEALRKLIDAISVNAEKLAKPRYFFVCGSEKRTWSGPVTATFLSDLKQMLDQNKTGIPVNAGFDIKEIGGKMFEAEAVINTLINLICGGMRYPREFLEGGKENERLWLGWTVTYGEEQNEVASAVENQLWKRHLWCLFGKQVEVSKQGIKKEGVPEDKRRKRDVFVPQLEWQPEGRWSKAAELDLIYKAFNFANPVYPQTKLALEQRVVEILGLKGVKLPTQDELLQEMEKAEEMLAKEKGPQPPPTGETLEKRKEKGSNIALHPSGEEGSGKGQSRPMGGPRVPREAKKPFSETVRLDVIAKNLSEEDKAELAKFINEKKGTVHDFIKLKIEAKRLENEKLSGKNLELSIENQQKKKELHKKIEKKMKETVKDE